MFKTNESNFLERVIPEEAQYALWQEHIGRYAFVLSHAQNKAVLDVACGTGYGTELASKTATVAVGVDICSEALTYAKKHYGRNSKTEFVLADASDLPFRDSAFDVVVSFETIEHLMFHEDFLQEIRRTLRMNGELIMSTPNGKILSSRREKPRNPFHLREFARSEFSQLITVFSSKMELYGQCPYTLKDSLFPVLERHIPLSLRIVFSKLSMTISESSAPQVDARKTIDPVYRVRKIRDLHPLYGPRFLVVVVKNEKR